jgi:hypothetical protein
MKRSLFTILVLFLTANLYSQHRMFPEPLSPRLANYRIDVTLDPAGKLLNGK